MLIALYYCKILHDNLSIQFGFILPSRLHSKMFWPFGHTTFGNEHLQVKKYLPLFDMTLTIIIKHFCHKKNRLPAWRHDFVNKTKNRNGFCKFRYPDCGPSDVTQIVINKIKTLTQDVTGADLFGRLDLSEWHSWFLMLLRCWVSTDRWHPPPHLRREYYAPKPTTPLNHVMSPLIF